MGDPVNHEVKLPAMGEGIDDGDVVNMLVKVGDEVEVGQTICELETSKALLEIPSDASGKVEEIRFAEGDKIPVGETIIVLSGVSDTPQSAESTESAQALEAEPEPAANPVSTTPAAPTKPAGIKREPRIQPVARPEGAMAPAGPATRRMARELGVDVGQVAGSGPAGRITKEDVKGFIRSAVAGSGGLASEPPLPDFTSWGPVERVKPNKVRELTAQHMAQSWSAIPHVTQFDVADITDLEELRRRLDEESKEQGGRLTLTVIAMKALVPVLRAFPMFNSSRDPQTGETVQKYFYNLGIATATDRGLLVPVVRNVDRKNMLELAHELTGLAARAREGKLQPDEFNGGTFTISNQGGIGGGHFTPIVNHPQAAILAIGRSRIEPGYPPGDKSGEVQPRLMLPLAVSYDHRIIDGANAAAFIRRLKESLEDPGRLLLGL